MEDHSVKAFFLYQQSYNPYKNNVVPNSWDRGIWEITSGNTSPDGLSTSRPIYHVEGCFGDVVELAVHIPEFWGYGPGEITKIDVKSITEFKSIVQLFDERKKLQSQITKLNEQLKELK